LQELVNLPERDKEALGATATAGEIAQQPVTWRKTRRIFNQHADRLRTFLEAAAARSLAEKGYKRVCVLGSGALTGVAKDPALKVLEMTAGEVKTMAESVLGLRHGPMSALDTETLLVCFASSDMRRQRYEIDLLRELGVKEIVALRVVVGSAGSADLATCSEQYLMIGEGVPDLYRPPVDVMLGQLLGLSFSLAHGLKPDAPSPHGVISRVVGESRIYEQAA
jgi:tagatose-6-phosphate ketose/aldose isomerase